MAIDVGILITLGFYLSIAIVFAILALGFNLQWGYTGHFNAGIAGFFLIGAYTCAIAITAPAPPVPGGLPGHLGGFSLPFPVGAALAMLAAGGTGSRRDTNLAAPRRLSRDCDDRLRRNCPNLHDQPGDHQRRDNRYPPDPPSGRLRTRTAVPEHGDDRRDRRRDSPHPAPVPPVRGGVAVGSGPPCDTGRRRGHHGPREEHVPLQTAGLCPRRRDHGARRSPLRRYTRVSGTCRQLRAGGDLLRLGHGDCGRGRQPSRSDSGCVPDLRDGVALRPAEGLCPGRREGHNFLHPPHDYRSLAHPPRPLPSGGHPSRKETHLEVSAENGFEPNPGRP